MAISVKLVTPGRHAISNALVDLREHLGETQQQFANRIGAAVTTVARWETKRPPKGKILAQLEQAARNSGAVDIAEFFHTTLQKELGGGAFDPIRKARMNPWRLYTSEMLTQVFQEFIERSNARGSVVTAVRLEFDTGHGNTTVLDVAPPEIQTVKRNGKWSKQKIRLPRGPRFQIIG